MYIPVIYYHSVAPKKKPGWIKNYLTLELEKFEYQMNFLKKNGYETIFLDEYFELLSKRENKKKKYVCITFDDGFLDNWIYAYPILKNLNFKATIFICPEFVDLKNSVRSTLEDYWKGKVSFKELERWGFMTWDELIEMESSGLIDIQSHTMSHAELFVSDKIIDFHHPGSQFLYPISNLYPERKPYYIEDEEFENLLPYGYPFFESQSAVIARKIDVNPEFINQIIKSFKDVNWDSSVSFNKLFKRIEPVYKDLLKNDLVIMKRESEKEYNDRLMYELKGSKDIIEKQLRKEVSYLCWPNHDYNDYVHLKAREVGYKATVVILKPNEKRKYDRFDRISIYHMNKENKSSLIKARLKLNGYHLMFPFNYLYSYREKYN